MANTYPVKISFQAVDQVTAKVRDISSKIRAITKPVRDQSDAFADLGRSLMLDKISQGIGNVRSAVGDLVGSLARVGFIAAGAFGGLFATVQSFVSSADEINDTSKRLGIGTKSLQELRFAAKQSGIEASDLDTGLKFLNKNMVEAAKGSGDAAKVFQALGIKTTFANGKLKSVDEMLPELADKFKNIRSGALKTSLAMTIFGKSGDKMSLLLGQGAEGIAKLREEAGKSGAVINEDDIQAAAKFDDLMNSLKASFLGVRNTIGAALLPVFTDLAETLKAFFLENREAFGEFAKALGEGLKAMLPALVSGLKSLTEAMKSFAALPAEEKAAMISTAFKLLTALALLPTIASIGSLIGSLASLAQFFTPLLSTILTNKTALSLLGAGFNTLAAILPVIGKSLLAVAMNPVGLTIMAVAGAVYLLYRNWDSFLGLLRSSWAFIEEYWGKLKDIFGMGGNEVTLKTAAQAPALGGQETLQARIQNEQAGRDVNMSVNFANMPRGTQVATQNNGGVNMDLALGYSMAGF